MLTLTEISAASGDVEVRYMAGLECCLALWTAVAPDPEPRRATAQRLLAAMPDETRALAWRLDRRLPGWQLRAASWFYRLGERPFDEAMDALGEQSPERLALELAIPSLIGPDRSDGPCAYSDDLRAARLEGALRRPQRTVQDVTSVVGDFWSCGFRDVWRAQLAALDRAAERLAAPVSTDFGRTLAALSPRVSHDAEEDAVRIRGGQARQSLSCAGVGLDAIVGAWMRRRIALVYSPTRAGVCVGLPGAAEESLSEDELTATMAVLGAPRRLDIVRLCMAEPLSIQDLSARLGITVGPVCRHLKTLERHKLVVGQRFGRQVTYSAVPETLSMLGRSLTALGSAAPISEQVARAVA